MFRKGQKIVCINENWGSSIHNEIFPKKGEVYTLRCYCDCGRCSPGIFLNEIVNPPADYNGHFIEPSWHPGNFRPVVEKPTSIAIFTAMLTPSPKQVEKV